MILLLAVILSVAAGSFGSECEVDFGGDINKDCRVNLLDMSIMARDWLKESEPNVPSVIAGRVFYAEPDGTGDGSADAPMSIADFWDAAIPGDTLMLRDGLYQGLQNMIQPTGLVHGQAGLPITVMAINDGKATIDGEGKYEPVKLFRNSYMNLIGFNAANSSENVVLIKRSFDVNVRRVCGWDARDGNCFIFWATESQFIVFEDCAGWGIARKIFTNAHYGDHVTFRRCWASWDGGHHVGPKMAFSSYYDSVGCVIEDCAGTWTASRMKEHYFLLDDHSEDTDAEGNKTYHYIDLISGQPKEYFNYQVEEDKDNAIFGFDDFHNISPEPANVIIRNCISYTQDKTPQTHFHGRAVRYTDPIVGYRYLGYYRMFDCFAWQSEYGNGSRLAFALESAEAFDARLRFPQSVKLVDDASITYETILAVSDGPYIFPLPIHDRVLALTGHDMTQHVPAKNNNTYYAAPGGTGSGRSEGDPMSVRSFFGIALPGDTLILLDGTYTFGVDDDGKEYNDLIQPCRYLSGVAGRPITIKAQNDGGAVFDGQGVREPVSLLLNDYWTIEGVHAANSPSNVVWIRTCNNVKLSRITATGAGAASSAVFYVWGCNSVEVDQCAGWGRADAIFKINGTSSNVSLGYCFGVYTDGYHDADTQCVFTASSSTSSTFDHCIGVWDAIAVHSAPKGLFIFYNSVVTNCIGLGRAGAVQNPDHLFYLQNSQVSNCLVWGKSPGTNCVTASGSSGGPFEIKGCECSNDCGKLTLGKFTCDINEWPMQERVLLSSGESVDSIIDSICNPIDTLYVSPQGGGDGLSMDRPMTLTQWYSHAAAGSTCYLLDGVYQGADNMLNPTWDLSGTEAKPIRIIALNDQQVVFDGQFQNIPLSLLRNNYITIEGVRFENSSAEVAGISECTGVKLKRICAHDAGWGSKGVYWIRNSRSVSLESCAGWGAADATYLVSTCDAVELSYCYGVWQKPSGVANRFVFSIRPDNRNVLMDKCIGLWEPTVDISQDNLVCDVFVCDLAAMIGMRNCVARDRALQTAPRYLFNLTGCETYGSIIENCLAYGETSSTIGSNCACSDSLQIDYRLSKTCDLPFVFDSTKIGSWPMQDLILEHASGDKYPQDVEAVYMTALQPAEWYVSPDGVGSGRSAGDPMSLQMVYAFLKPDDTCYLVDGIYRGAGNMIAPLPGTFGTAESPIVIRALHEGAVIVDGEGSFKPLLLNTVRHFIIDGIELQNSSGEVATVLNCSNITLRRIMAHDSGVGAKGDYWMSASQSIRLESCAGWGAADTTYLFSTCDGVEMSYCFGVWQKPSGVANRFVFSVASTNSNVLMDKCVGLWEPAVDVSGDNKISEVFVCDLQSLVGIRDCVARNRTMLPSPRYLFHLTGCDTRGGIVDNCLAYCETPEVGGSDCLCGNPVEIEYHGCQNCSSSYVFDDTRVGDWPMRDRIINAIGLDVPSLYQPAANTEWYVSADADMAGSGQTPDDPMILKKWLAIAKPGDVCYLKDGVYRGVDNMLVPPKGISGKAGLPITVEAMNAGGVRFDGQEQYLPMFLNGDDYWHVKGIDFCNSPSHVVELYDSDHCVLSEVCAWDYDDSDMAACHIYHAEMSGDFLLEDCAGWGRAVQIYGLYGSGTWGTARRCWADWQGTDYSLGFKTAFAVSDRDTAYMNLYDCIGRWSADRSYESTRGVFGVSGGKVPSACTGLNRCIAYTQQTENRADSLFYLIGNSSALPLALKDCRAASIPAGSDWVGFRLWSCAGGPIEAVESSVIFGDGRTVAEGPVDIPRPFAFPINERVRLLTGHNVLTTLGLD
jgi:hypothetical protein